VGRLDPEQLRHFFGAKKKCFFSLWQFPPKSQQIVSISCLDMKILYFSSSGAIPSTFLLGQRIIVSQHLNYLSASHIGM